MTDQVETTVTVTLTREEAQALQRRERLNDEDQQRGEAEERGKAKIRAALDAKDRASVWIRGRVEHELQLAEQEAHKADMKPRTQG